MSAGKAPGPDGIPAEIYKNLPPLYPYIAKIINGILTRGIIPRELRHICVVPLSKPGKDPQLPSSKRPISFLRTSMEIMECIITQRILPAIEPQLYSGQFAYLRSRSSEHHMNMLTDVIHRSLHRKKHVCVVSYDIRAAFDCVSHHQLMRALPRFGVNPHIRRIIHDWLNAEQRLV